MLTKLKKYFAPTAGALGLSTILAFSGAAHAGNALEDVLGMTSNTAGTTRASTTAQKPVIYNHLGMCNEYVTENGHELGAIGSAARYSEGKDNDIGIFVLTGRDIDPRKAVSWAQQITDFYNRNGLVAKCFVGPHSSDRPTVYGYAVNGMDVPEDSRGLNADQFKSKAIIKDVAMAARLDRKAGIKGDPHYLPSERIKEALAAARPD